MLGDILNPTDDIKSAIEQTGINWNARLANVMFTTPQQEKRIVPNKYVVYKSTTFDPIGVVGGQYEICQNSTMWDFIADFIKYGCSDCKVTSGIELKGGSQVVVIVRGNGKEFISGDEIYEYFVFRNSFDGSSPLQVFFTNIRIVCENTLLAAIGEAKRKGTMHVIRHTKSLNERLHQVSDIIAHNKELQEEFNESMRYLASVNLNTEKTVKVVKSVMFPEKANMSKRGITIRNNNINEVLRLVDEGRGTDIPGVRGTAYGLFNAFTEWVDHYKPVKVPKKRNAEEVRFESNIFTTNASMKVNVLNRMVTYPY